MKNFFHEIMIRFFSRWFFVCQLEGCMNFTSKDKVANSKKNIRQRWLLEAPLDEGTMTLCPDHLREMKGFEEKDYLGLEHAEATAREVQNVVRLNERRAGVRRALDAARMRVN